MATSREVALRAHARTSSFHHTVPQHTETGLDIMLAQLWRVWFDEQASKLIYSRNNTPKVLQCKRALQLNAGACGAWSPSGVHGPCDETGRRDPGGPLGWPLRAFPHVVPVLRRNRKSEQTIVEPNRSISGPAHIWFQKCCTLFCRSRP